MQHSISHPAGAHGKTGMETMGHSKNSPPMRHSHNAHMQHLWRRFWVCLALAVPVLLLSPMMGVALPFQLAFSGSGYVVAGLSSILFFYGGWPFLQGAKAELREKKPAMMTLVAMGITVAYFYSLYAFAANTFFHGRAHVMDFFWELATLIVVMLLGHAVEMRAVAGAGNALQGMAKLLPGAAHLVLEGGATKDIPPQELQAGQRVRVAAGEAFPADGVVEEGTTSVNEAMVTGESRLVPKAVGGKVTGGTQNGAGTVAVRVTAAGEQAYLAQVMALVGRAQREKTRAETVSDKVACALFYVALLAGLLAFGFWFAFTGSMATALGRMVTVFVIACPHALGLAIPLVVARSTSLAAQNGLLVRSRKALETAAKVDVVVMDKTGTLTEGRFTVRKVLSFREGYSENDILAMMAALESGSTHPLASGILAEAKVRHLPFKAASGVQSIVGTGLSGRLPNGRFARVANAPWLEKNGILYDEDIFAELAAKGWSISYLLVEESPAGLVALGDALRPEAAEMVQNLKKAGLTPVMLTGDNKAAAGQVAKALGITQMAATVLPENKEKIVSGYRQSGHVVMMVGDGVNDAPALAAADVGVAVGAGTDIAKNTADAVLVRSGPADITAFLRLAKATSRKMRQNLFWGAGYNAIAIPLAAGVLAPLGILLSPAAGAVLMSLSTVIVALNALSLRIKR